MNRREFLLKSGISSLILGLSPQILISQTTKTPTAKKLCILHTNDQHSRIEPFDSSGGRNAGKGGFARRAHLISEIRKTENNLLLLDSGDTFQGTPYFNLFHGELEFKLMSMMKYDASTMGNHDFDIGLEGFLKAKSHASFPFISSNYDFTNTVLDGKNLKYKIFNKNGIKVGIFGLGINFDGLVGKKQFLETKYLDPIDIAQEYSKKLKIDETCDFVICLSHLGYKYADSSQISDIELAKKTENIDLILGGHTHTFLPEPQYYPNKNGKNILINQVGFAGLLLGRIDFYFDKNKKIQSVSFNNEAITHKYDKLLS